MRIGLVSGEYPPKQGGVGDFTRELATAMAEQGCEVHVITGDGQSSISTYRIPNPVGQPPAPAVHRVIRRWNWASLLRLRRLAHRLELDLLNVQYQAAAYGLSAPIHFLPRVAGVPVVVTFHDLRIPYLFPKAGGLRWQAVLALARGTAAAIVTNSADEARLQQVGGVNCLTQIPIGSNIAPSLPPAYDQAEWRHRLGVAPGDWLLGYFGFLNASKGGETLVRALALLAAHGHPARLLLIGGRTGASDPTDAGYGVQVDALARELGVAERILRTGFVAAPEVSASLAACDLLVLPYRDGASFRRGSLMAALAHGRPIVSTTPQEPQPGLQDGENIRLAPPDSPEALAAAVEALMAAPDLRDRLGQGALALAGQFGWPQIAARTVQLFEAVR